MKVHEKKKRVVASKNIRGGKKESKNTKWAKLLVVRYLGMETYNLKTGKRVAPGGGKEDGDWRGGKG